MGASQTPRALPVSPTLPPDGRDHRASGDRLFAIIVCQDCAETNMK